MILLSLAVIGHFFKSLFVCYKRQLYVCMYLHMIFHSYLYKSYFAKFIFAHYFYSAFMALQTFNSVTMTTDIFI